MTTISSPPDQSNETIPRNDTIPITTTTTFTFPPHHSFPPFYTLQPNQTTLLRQLTLWSSLIQSYATSTLTHKLTLSTATTSPLFSNSKIHRCLDALSIRRILDFMSTSEGGFRAEWVKSGSNKDNKDKNVAWLWWRRPEEWADRINDWVHETGQKGTVLTIYELRESDAVATHEWVTMDEDQLRTCLDVLVKKGKAQVFGQHDGAGVKFF